MYVLYDNPTDFPGEFVIRVHNVMSVGKVEAEPELFFRTKNVGEAIDKMKEMGLYPLGRYPEDDPKIMNVFI